MILRFMAPNVQLEIKKQFNGYYKIRHQSKLSTYIELIEQVMKQLFKERCIVTFISGLEALLAIPIDPQEWAKLVASNIKYSAESRQIVLSSLNSSQVFAG